jgi:hypothetical protein
VTENRTPELTLRIRLISLPKPGEMDDINLEHYHAGQIYVLPSRLATLLILSGHAELVVSHPARAEAADFGHPRFPRKK